LIERLSVILIWTMAPIGREEMRAERPKIAKAVEQIATAFGYKLERGRLFFVRVVPRLRHHSDTPDCQKVEIIQQLN
jgi:hypothetical protein